MQTCMQVFFVCQDVLTSTKMEKVKQMLIGNRILTEPLNVNGKHPVDRLFRSARHGNNMSLPKQSLISIVNQHLHLYYNN